MNHQMSDRRRRQMAFVDDMPPGLRACVHEFGLPIVFACLEARVTSPAAIRQLVAAIWAGARQVSQRSDAYDTLDWLLVQADSRISGRTLRRVLAGYNLAIVPESPTRAMLNASMAEVSDFQARITKEEKHRRRLRAAIRAHTAECLVEAG